MADEREEGEIPQSTEMETGEPDYNKKHPLESKWTLWFDSGNAGSKSVVNWGQTLRPIYSFGTVEEFWSLYNNIVPPSKLAAGMDFSIFKEGIEPKWEDAKCESGGKWTALVPRGRKEITDTFWLNSLLACIGEQFTESDDVCGVVVSVRAKQDRVSLWTKTASNEAAQISLGKQFRQLLEVPDTERIGYLSHSDAKNLDRKAKDKYTV